eukprot:CAMPEP_0182589054 /NCGR_PEP_ID=MMETSP1324-20130603/68685_1 /TAXON_ID=236786 /ORGANISM="Florenciella sp., Strain RCC1587" /LENGTH=122 /DNA_ID=CAMNT_0024806175 /DNA_START=11 /DNA_END=375 /DNA_ORIENTATION=+
MTANPTDTPVFATTDAELRAAVEGASSGETIVVKNDIDLTGPLWFPEGLVGVVLRGEVPGTTLAGDGTFRLVAVVGTELVLEDLVLTGGYSESTGAAVAVVEGKLWAKRCTFRLNRAHGSGG